MTAQLFTQIMQIHALESPAELIQAVHALAYQAHIRSVIAVVKGKKTPEGYDSGCFADGRCYLYTTDTTDTTAAEPESPNLFRRGSEEALGRMLADLDRQMLPLKAQLSEADYTRAYDAAVAQRMAAPQSAQTPPAPPREIDDATKQWLRANIEQKLAPYKTKWRPEIYQDTVETVYRRELGLIQNRRDVS